MEKLNDKALEQAAGGSYTGDWKLVEYVVQKGDTLGAIGAKYGVNWRTQIYDHNKETIGPDPNYLGVGMRLFFYAPAVNCG